MLRIAYTPAPALGAIIVTPGQMLDEMKTIDIAVDELALRVTQQLVATGRETTWANAWQRFRQEWKAFYNDHLGWTDRLWGGAYDKMLEYRQRLYEWNQQFEQIGGRTVGPELSPTPPSEVPYLDRYKPLIIGGGVIIGGAVLWLLLRRLVPVATAKPSVDREISEEEEMAS